MSGTPRKWKREPLPAFCDATASVSATQFGARRVPEIKALWKKVRGEDDATSSYTFDVKALQSGGRKTSSRHLRRRATSHKSHKHYRRCLPKPTKGTEGETESGEHIVSKSRRARRQKATLLQSEHEDWRSLVHRHIPAQSTEVALDSENVTNEDATVNGVDHSETSSIKANWMMTHVWHAKRFRTEHLWGWKVPVLHSNRGCAAALRLVREEKCLLQDATWCMQPVWFQVAHCQSSESRGADATATSVFHKRVGRILPDFATTPMNPFDRQFVSGEDILHQIDCFPSAAIGPVTWIWTRTPLTGRTASSVKNCSFVYFFVHPSVLPLAIACFEGTMRNCDATLIQGPFRGIEGGVACFKVRGSSAANCLQMGLTSAANNYEVEDMAAFNDFVEQGVDRDCHGSMFWTSVTKNEDETPMHTCFRCIRPRDPSRQTNWAACGYDVFCGPTHAKVLYHRLVVSGGACPIGIAEEAYLSLECDPPMPLFPRDYPDTDQGASYWNATASTEWTCVRKHWEGGDGRIPIRCESRCFSLSWTDLTREADATSNEGSIVVVRGSFCEPFRNALSGSAQPPATRITASPRRKRRSANIPRPFVEAACLTVEQFSAQQDFCKSLAKALALPALLVCHVLVIGKGALKAGSRLYSIKNDDGVLGFATTGAFSVARGLHHGIAVVGAARFLETVAASRYDRSCIVTQRLEGRKELQLKVRCKNANSDFFEGTLSILG